MNLDAPISQFSRVGPSTLKVLAKLGITTCRDVIMHAPFRYDDFSSVIPIASLQQSMTATVHGTIQMIRNRRSFRRRMVVTEALIEDETGSIKVIWFNQPFLVKNLATGDAVNLSGKTSENFLDLQFVNPHYEKVVNTGAGIHTGRIVPVYSLTEKLTQKQFRALVHAALKYCGGLLPEWLPDEMTKGLRGRAESLQAIHFPESIEDFECARERLAFDELFRIQLHAFHERAERERIGAPLISSNDEKVAHWIGSLPFGLTGAQQRSIREIIEDCARAVPMNRLLEGDVGSGKTAVAAAAAINAAAAGFQVALMAPTDILAQQHYASLTRYIGSQASVALLTRRRCESARTDASHSLIQRRKAVMEDITLGSVSIIVGTHSLIQESVRFDTLGLVIIDEQHRFGVSQRKQLQSKRQDGRLPHLLSMTATPIPRSLALTVYGDLDLSILDEMPVGRRPIITKIVPAEYREWTYDFVRKSVTEGRQTFIICPTIDQSDVLGVKSVTQEYERLARDIFPELRLGMLHGKMKSEDREDVMQSLLDHSLDILVATSVIEVGVDVPNATVILIEGAERFGLAQLHQFRGRVGRSHYQSYCFLLPTDPDSEPASRLQALVDSTNGFELAEKDIELRGSGDMFGSKQSGLPSLNLARITDTTLIHAAREWAKKLAPQLDAYPLMRAELSEFSDSVHFE